MDSPRHVITRILDPPFFNQIASYDVASTIHLSLGCGESALNFVCIPFTWTYALRVWPPRCCSPHYHHVVRLRVS